MNTEEETSDFSACDEDFPFSVDLETALKNTAVLCLKNARDKPIRFKALVLNPEELFLKPANGKVMAKCSIRIYVKRRRNQDMPEPKIKFLVKSLDTPPEDVARCDCGRLQWLCTQVFEKTMTVQFAEEKRMGQRIKDVWDTIKSKGQRMKDVWGKVQSKVKIYPAVRSSWFIVLCFILIYSSLLSLITYQLACKKTETNYWCNVPFIKNYMDCCRPTWKSTVASKICYL